MLCSRRVVNLVWYVEANRRGSHLPPALTQCCLVHIGSCGSRVAWDSILEEVLLEPVAEQLLVCPPLAANAIVGSRHIPHSPLVVQVLFLKMTIGMDCPMALTQPTMVICSFLPATLYRTFFSPGLVITLGGRWSRGIPLSFIL